MPAPSTARTVPAPQPEPPPLMTLKGIKVGIIRSPDRELIIGTEGVGKTTWAAGADSPIFIAAEEGTHHLDIHRFPQPRNFSDVMEAIRVLENEEHSYKTVVFDTMDWIEGMIITDLCRRNGWENIESPGYGKGWSVLPDEWRKFIAALEKLRTKKPMEVIFVVHADVKNFTNPAGSDYSRYTAALTKHSYPTLRAWVDSILFAAHE